MFVGTTETALDIAARLHLPVFPCGRNKTPAISREKGGHGFQDATEDEAGVRALFDKAGDAARLVGVPTGAASGFDVLDIDPRHGGDKWEAENAHRLPETRMHRTLNGGRHYLFRHAPGVRNSASKQEIAPGVDVRGDGGYIIHPPSPGYQIISDAEIIDWPDWLLTLVLKRDPTKDRPPPTTSNIEISSRRLDGLTKSILARVQRAPEGGKHFALRNAALSLGGIQQIAGFSDDQAVDMLIQALPGTVINWESAKETARWGLTQGRSRPLELEDRPEYAPRNGYHVTEDAPDTPDDPGYWLSVEIDAPPPEEPTDQPAEPPRVFDPWNTLQPVVFPLEAIPDALRTFVVNRAAAIGADPGAIAWAALCACSAAIHGETKLHMKRHDPWTVAPALWVALIGAPSTKKSPIIDLAWRPLVRIQSAELSAHQARYNAWSALPKKQRDEEDEPKIKRRLVSNDGTMEALQDILSRQNRGIGVVRDELAGWIGSMDKYAPGKGSAADRAFWLQSFNGGSHVVDRVMRGTLNIDNLLTAICGGIQPDRLAQFKDLTDDGLFQRFIPYIVAPGSIGGDEPLDVSVDQFAALVNRLLSEKPARLDLSDAAHETRESIQKRLHELEQAEVLGGRFTGFVGKLVGIWGRLCLVLHMISDSATSVVSGETAKAARSLLFRSIIPNAARVYTAMGGAGGEMEATQSIAGYILTKGLERILMSDLTRNVRVCRGRSIADVQKLVSPLEAGGWLQPERDFNATSWKVAAQVHVFFAERARKETTRRILVRALITGVEDDD